MESEEKKAYSHTPTDREKSALFACVPVKITSAATLAGRRAEKK
jgi:hypothetical protein